MKKKETVSVNEEMKTREQDRGSVQTDEVTPFWLRHLPRLVSLEAVLERDEDERALLSWESRDRTQRDTESRVDSLDFDQDNDNNTQEDESTVRFYTIESF